MQRSGAGFRCVVGEGVIRSTPGVELAADTADVGQLVHEYRA